MDDWKLPWDGGCRCDRVRIKVTAPPMLTSACHCSGCQRMSSSPYSLTLTVPGDGFAVTVGEPVIGGLHGAAQHYFCGHCMSWMFTRPPAGAADFVNVRPTMLDDHSWFVPFLETWTREKVPWATTPAVVSHPTQPAFEDYQGLVEQFMARSARP